MITNSLFRATSKFLIKWDLQMRNELWRFGNDYSCVLSIAISPDSNILATGNEYGSIKLWKISDEKLCDKFEK